MGKTTDILLLTDPRYVNPAKVDPYVANILHEERLVRDALEEKGLKVGRISWDDPGKDWSETAYVMFRTTWDYFDRYAEFGQWLERVRSQTEMINPYPIIRWNLDKHYLGDLEQKGIRIPPTRYIEKGDERPLGKIVAETGWREVILKPVVSGAARHTYRFMPEQVLDHEQIFRRLIREESMMIQEFQHRVITRGEVAFMLFGGRYSHAVLKRAKKGDFRVQDDFGGTVDHYEPSPDERTFAEQVVALCEPLPLYARVDAVWDNSGRMALSELELIEPELWFRFYPPAAGSLASAVMSHMKQSGSM